MAGANELNELEDKEAESLAMYIALGVKCGPRLSITNPVAVSGILTVLSALGITEGVYFYHGLV